MHNVYVNQVRSRHDEVLVDDDSLDAPQRPTQTDLLEVRDIDAALRRLPADQREVLLLVALERMSYGEAARALSIPIGTVMMSGAFLPAASTAGPTLTVIVPGYFTKALRGQ